MVRAGENQMKRSLGLGIAFALALALTSDVNATEVYGMLAADQYNIDQCYFGSAATPPGISRDFNGCTKDGGMVVDGKIARQRVQCAVTYNPSEIYKPRFQRAYIVEYQYDKRGSKMYVRIPIVNASRVLENPDSSCDLGNWQASANQ
jgi:hypothetical protein